MSSTKFFNFPYLKQNLKKSRVTLTFLFLIIPVLTFISLLITGSKDFVTVLGFYDISAITVFGMYILPVVISIILFSFVFKKKSVDFMGSMPIDRKTIFFTNTLGGMMIIAVLLFVTMILMMLASFLFPNLYIPFLECVDYFVVYFLSYSFVFTACNIAVSVSGNVVTSLVVTALIVFFVPFHHCVFSNSIWNQDYHVLEYNAQKELLPMECDEEDYDCIDDYYYSPYFHPVEETTNYTLPFGIVAGVMNDGEGAYQNEVLGKMLLLSLLYIFVGCLLFEKKEMEVCETSFKKFWHHQLVKSLTLIPIFVLASVVLLDSEFGAWLLVLAIILIYNFAYDLITKRQIEKIFLNLLNFALVGIVVIGFCSYAFQEENGLVDGKEFVKSDVQSIEINLKGFANFGDKQRVLLENKDLISKILDCSFINTNHSQEEFSLIFKIFGKRYRATYAFDDETRDELIQYIQNTKEYQSIEPQEVLKKGEYISVGYGYGDFQLDSAGIDLLKATFKKEISSGKNLQIPIHIYTYENHSLNDYTVYSNIHSDLQKHVLSMYNSKIDTTRMGTIYYIDFVNSDYTVLDNRNNARIVDILKKQKNIDFSKPIYHLEISHEHGDLDFYTNMSDELRSYLTSSTSTKDERYVD